MTPDTRIYSNYEIVILADVPCTSLQASFNKGFVDVRKLIENSLLESISPSNHLNSPFSGLGFY